MKLYLPALIILLSAAPYIHALKPFSTRGTLTLESSDIRIFEIENLNLKKMNQRNIFQLDENINKDLNSYDLYLDFENPLSSLQNYNIIYSKFELNKYQYVNGNYSGKFYFSDNYISLLPLPSSILAPGNITGSFTIDFWLYDYKNYDNQNVIKYIGNNLSDEKDKNIYGFSIYIRNGRVVYKFDNFFFTEKNESVSVEVMDDENIVLNKWEHHALTFDIKSGKLSVYKNGIEQEVRWITQNGMPLSAVLTPRIKEELSTPILIGKDAFFSLDNFKITRNAVSNFDLKKFNTGNSYLITDVYKYSSNKASLTGLSFESDLPQYSYIKYAYRVSDSYFLPGDKNIKWIYIRNGADRFPDGFDSGKYIQFKMQVYPYEGKDQAINIYSVKLDYTLDNTPDIPFITGVQALDGKIVLTWIPSPEDDIAGYEIYYGNNMSDYICNDAAEGKSPVFVKASDPGRLYPITFTISGLANEKPYFISVRSVDKNGNRSPYSKEVYSRPSTIYNKDGYSIDR